MTPFERELLLAIARFIVAESPSRSALQAAIDAVEGDKRCPFDGNPEPCVHHTSPEAFWRIIAQRKVSQE